MNINDIMLINAPCFASEWLSAYRYTDDAREVLRFTAKRCMECKISGKVPPVMLLWSMLCWHTRLGIAVFEECGGNRRVLKQDILTEGCFSSGAPSEFHLDMQDINDLAITACHESQMLGKDYVGTEHLFLALLRFDDEILRRLFTKHGVTYELFKTRLSYMQ